MSAHMVNDAHIDVMIDLTKQFRNRYATLAWRWGNPPQRKTLSDYNSKTDLGRMLLAENTRSVGERYREGQSPAALLYTYRPTHKEFTCAQALNTLSGYEYQACENDDYEQSEAFAFCFALRAFIVNVAVPTDNCIEAWSWTDSALSREPAAI